MQHPSVVALWERFIRSDLAPSGLPVQPSSVFHFCDTPDEANECAALVLEGRKHATSPSLWGFEERGDPVPAPGDHHVITDWDGIARCVIRTTDVAVVPFDEVTAEHAAAEGEGDRSLAWWRQAHWAYYQRELAGTGRVLDERMPIVCERFVVVFPP